MNKINSITAAILLTISSAELSANTDYPDWYVDKSPDPTIEHLGLEWMTWDQTKSMSISDALTMYEADGWRLATNKEVASLFNGYFLDLEGVNTHTFEPGPDETFPGTPSYFVNAENALQTAYSPAAHDNGISFLETFGITDYLCDTMVEGNGCVTWSSALFGADADGDGKFNLASFAYHEFADENTYATLSADDYDPGYTMQVAKMSASLEVPTEYSTGVALVRNLGYVPTEPTAVPELDAKKSVIAFALLIGIMFMVRERFQRTEQY